MRFTLDFCYIENFFLLGLVGLMARERTCQVDCILCIDLGFCIIGSYEMEYFLFRHLDSEIISCIKIRA